MVHPGDKYRNCFVFILVGIYKRPNKVQVVNFMERLEVEMYFLTVLRMCVV